MLKVLLLAGAIAAPVLILGAAGIISKDNVCLWLAMVLGLAWFTFVVVAIVRHREHRTPRIGLGIVAGMAGFAALAVLKGIPGYLPKVPLEVALFALLPLSVWLLQPVIMQTGEQDDSR